MTAKEAIFQAMGWTEDAKDAPGQMTFDFAPAGGGLLGGQNQGGAAAGGNDAPNWKQKEKSPEQILKEHDRKSHKGGYKGGKCTPRGKLKAKGFDVRGYDLKVHNLDLPDDYDYNIKHGNEDEGEEEESTAAPEKAAEGSEEGKKEISPQPEKVDINGTVVEPKDEKAKETADLIKEIVNDPDADPEIKKKAEESVKKLGENPVTNGEGDKKEEPAPEEEKPEEPAVEETAEEESIAPEEEQDNTIEIDENLYGPMSDEDYEIAKESPAVLDFKQRLRDYFDKGGTKIDASEVVKGSIYDRAINDVLAEREAMGQKVKDYEEAPKEESDVDVISFEDVPEETATEEPEVAKPKDASATPTTEKTRGNQFQNLKNKKDWTPAQRAALAELAKKIGAAAEGFRRGVSDEKFNSLLNDISHFSDVKKEWAATPDVSEDRGSIRETLTDAMGKSEKKSYNEIVMDEINVLLASDKVKPSLKHSLEHCRDTMGDLFSSDKEVDNAHAMYRRLCEKYGLDEILEGKDDGSEDKTVDGYLNDGDENHRKGGVVSSESKYPDWKVNLDDISGDEDRNGKVNNPDEIKNKIVDELTAEKLPVDIEDISEKNNISTTDFSFKFPKDVKVTKALINRLKESIARNFPLDKDKGLAINYDERSDTLVVTVENHVKGNISQKTLLKSPEFQAAIDRGEIPIALGIDENGKPQIGNLSDFVHVLLAGQTGSGKSARLGSIVSSLLAQSPDNVRLIVVDPKKVEFSFLEGDPHLIGGVVTESDEAVDRLRYLVNEQENRYRLFKKAGVRNLKEYNDLAKAGKLPEGLPTKLPAISLVIDEFGDLMDTNGKDIEKLVKRLGQKSRAAGVHLVLATQRPTADSIPTNLRANLPTTIGMNVKNAAEARYVGVEGLEQLPQKGPLIIKTPDGKTTRLDGSYIDLNGLEKLVESGKGNPVNETPTGTEEVPGEGETAAPEKTPEQSADEIGETAQEKAGLKKIAQRIANGEMKPFAVPEAMAEKTKQLLSAQGIEYTETKRSDGLVAIAPKPKTQDESTQGESATGTANGDVVSGGASESTGATGGEGSAETGTSTSIGSMKTVDLSNKGFTSNFPIQKDLGDGKLEIPIGTFTADRGYDWQGKPDNIDINELGSILRGASRHLGLDIMGILNEGKERSAAVKLGNGKVAIYINTNTKSGFDQSNRASQLERVAFVDEATANKYGDQIAQHLMNMPIPAKGSDPSLKENTTIFTPSAESTTGAGETETPAPTEASGTAGTSEATGTETKEQTPLEQQKTTEREKFDEDSRDGYDFNHGSFDETMQRAREEYDKAISRAKNNTEKKAALDRYNDTKDMARTTLNDWRTANGLPPIKGVNKDGSYQIEQPETSQEEPTGGEGESSSSAPEQESGAETSQEEGMGEAEETPAEPEVNPYRDEEELNGIKEGYDKDELEDNADALHEAQKQYEQAKKGSSERAKARNAIRKLLKNDNALRDRLGLNLRGEDGHIVKPQTPAEGQESTGAEQKEENTTAPVENPYLDSTITDREDLDEFQKADLEDNAGRLNKAMNEWREARKVDPYSAETKNARKAFETALKEDNALRKELGMPERGRNGVLPQGEATKESAESATEEPKATEEAGAAASKEPNPEAPAEAESPSSTTEKSGDNDDEPPPEEPPKGPTGKGRGKGPKSPSPKSPAPAAPDAEASEVVSEPDTTPVSPAPEEEPVKSDTPADTFTTGKEGLDAETKREIQNDPTIQQLQANLAKAKAEHGENSPQAKSANRQLTTAITNMANAIQGRKTKSDVVDTRTKTPEDKKSYNPDTIASVSEATQKSASKISPKHQNAVIDAFNKNADGWNDEQREYFLSRVSNYLGRNKRLTDAEVASRMKRWVRETGKIVAAERDFEKKAKAGNPASVVDADEFARDNGKRVHDAATPKGVRAGTVKDFLAHMEGGDSRFPHLAAERKIAIPTKDSPLRDAWDSLSDEAKALFKAPAGKGEALDVVATDYDGGHSKDKSPDEIASELEKEAQAYLKWKNGESISDIAASEHQQRAEQREIDESRRDNSNFFALDDLVAADEAMQERYNSVLGELLDDDGHIKEFSTAEVANLKKGDAIRVADNDWPYIIVENDPKKGILKVIPTDDSNEGQLDTSPTDMVYFTIDFKNNKIIKSSPPQGEPTNGKAEPESDGGANAQPDENSDGNATGERRETGTDTHKEEKQPAAEPEELTLKSGETIEDINADNKRIKEQQQKAKQQKDMNDRLHSPLKGGRGDLGQADLFGENEDLFSRKQTEAEKGAKKKSDSSEKPTSSQGELTDTTKTETPAVEKSKASRKEAAFAQQAKRNEFLATAQKDKKQYQKLFKEFDAITRADPEMKKLHQARQEALKQHGRDSDEYKKADAAANKRYIQLNNEFIDKKLAETGEARNSSPKPTQAEKPISKGKKEEPASAKPVEKPAPAKPIAKGEKETPVSSKAEEKTSTKTSPQPKVEGSPELQKAINDDPVVKDLREQVAEAEKDFGKNSEEVRQAQNLLNRSIKDSKVNAIARLYQDAWSGTKGKAIDPKNAQMAEDFIKAVENRDADVLKARLATYAQKGKDGVTYPDDIGSRKGFEMLTGIKLPEPDKDAGDFKLSDPSDPDTQGYVKRMNKWVDDFCAKSGNKSTSQKPAEKTIEKADEKSKSTKPVSSEVKKADKPKETPAQAKQDSTPAENKQKKESTATPTSEGEKGESGMTPQMKAYLERKAAREKEEAAQKEKAAKERAARLEASRASVMSGKSDRGLNAQSKQFAEQARKDVDTSKSAGAKALTEIKKPETVSNESANEINKKLGAISDEIQDLTSKLKRNEEDGSMGSKDIKQTVGLIGHLRQGLQDILDKRQLGQGNFRFATQKDESGNLMGLKIMSYKGEDGKMKDVTLPEKKKVAEVKPEQKKEENPSKTNTATQKTSFGEADDYRKRAESEQGALRKKMEALMKKKAKKGNAATTDEAIIEDEYEWVPVEDDDTQDEEEAVWQEVFDAALASMG